MLISETNAIDGARIARSIGKISAVSIVRPAGRPVPGRDEGVLRALIRRAEDVDADAIVGLDYTVEPIVREGGVALERVCVDGIAVRIALAA